MSSTPSVSSSPWRIEFDTAAQIKAALVGVAFLAVFQNVLRNLWYTWTHNADWSHGPIIPLFSAYLIYLHWDRVRRSPIRGTGVGLGLLAASLLFYWFTLWGLLYTYLQAVAMMAALLGVVVFLCGLPVLRHVWVPWLYLFFAIPLPQGIYFRLTDPLRRMAATVATSTLNVLQLDVVREGSTLRYFYNGTVGRLEVADACSGMRSTITLCALGVAVAFVSDRPWWQRVIMIASCVPIAVFTNFIRVTTTCLLHVYVDPKYAEGNYHTALGLLTLLLAFGIFNGLGWVLSNLFVSEEAEPAGEGSAAR